MLLGLRSFRKPTARKVCHYILAALTLLDLLRYAFLCMRSPIVPDSRPLHRKLFIASTHWNNANILKSHWNQQIIQIAAHFGPSNVFVSVYESGSWDDTKGALLELREALQSLGVMYNIVLDPVTHTDEIAKVPGPTGWVDVPGGRKALRRIPYLSKMRNRSLEPLVGLRTNGTIFHQILFLNDVIFSVDDVELLLNTNGGTYAAACGLDYNKPAKFYDTFALRDSEGYEALMQTWPYFRSRQSRSALKADNAVPVVSCWNGMVAMDAAPFYDDIQPLSFRGIPDSLAQHHLEGSECCLIHQDNPLTARQGVYVNPNVRVGYRNAAYEAMAEQGSPRSVLVYLWRVWENRLIRWLTTEWSKRRVVQSRLATWKRAGNGENKHEGGVDCLIDEMHVLAYNGWAHV